MLEQASVSYAQALSESRAMRARPMEAQISLDFASLLGRLGQKSRARDLERAARALSDSLGTSLA